MLAQCNLCWVLPPNHTQTKKTGVLSFETCSKV